MTDTRKSCLKFFMGSEPMRSIDQPVTLFSVLWQIQNRRDRYTMEQITMAELQNMRGQNGLVFLDCMMAPQELLKLVNEVLTYGGILLDQSELKEVKSFQHDGTVDLILPFGNAKLESTKLVMWQVLTYKNCHGVFLSDYIHARLKEVQENSSTPQFGSMQM